MVALSIAAACSVPLSPFFSREPLHSTQVFKYSPVPIITYFIIIFIFFSFIFIFKNQPQHALSATTPVDTGAGYTLALEDKMNGGFENNTSVGGFANNTLS